MVLKEDFVNIQLANDNKTKKWTYWEHIESKFETMKMQFMWS